MGCLQSKFLYLIFCKIQKEMAVLDQALRLFLNPEDKRFLMSEPIDQFGFPAVDLDEIDLDWF